MAKRVRKKKIVQEHIYSSVGGATITSHQQVVEVLCRYRAAFLGIEFGDRFYDHPQLHDFCVTQWKDAANAVRKYGGRVVLTVLADFRWIADPKYGEHPLRIRRFSLACKTLKLQLGSELSEGTGEAKTSGTNETGTDAGVVPQGEFPPHSTKKFIPTRYRRDW